MSYVILVYWEGGRLAGWMPERMEESAAHARAEALGPQFPNLIFEVESEEQLEVQEGDLPTMNASIND